MDTPNPELMSLYGTDTYYLEKVGAISPRMREAIMAAAGGASIGAYQDDASHREQVLLEAEIMNRKLRAMEAYRMSSVVASLGGDAQASIAAGHEAPVISAVKLSSMDPELFALAERSGRSLVKHAGMGGGLGLLGSAANAIKGVFGGGGGVSKKITGALAKPKANPMAAPLKAGAEQVAKGPVKKPLISTGTKAKIGLGVAGAGLAAGTGYAGYKGLQATRDYMMQPSQQGAGQWGGYGPQPVSNVNQYGRVNATY
jgi:hypothetical protein